MCQRLLLFDFCHGWLQIKRKNPLNTAYKMHKVECHEWKLYTTKPKETEREREKNNIESTIKNEFLWIE